MYQHLVRRGLRLLALWVAGLLVAGCLSLPAQPPVRLPGSQSTALPQPTSASPPAAAALTWPTGGWRTTTPAEQGMNADTLAAALAAIKAQNLNLHSLLVIRHGAIVSETYFGSYQAETRHDLYSCTKSFVATLVGIALDKGLITGVAQPVLSFFPGRTIQNESASKAAMTLEDVLTMRTGLAWAEGEPAYRDLFMSGDWVRFMLDKPLVDAPGSRFNYCSGCSHLLTAIVQGQAGMNARAFAERELFTPLGITNLSWSTDAAGIPVGGWGLQLTPRDMAKLGYLYLHGGMWEGRQIVSAAWVQAATARQTTSNGPMGLGYGYQWWVIPGLRAYAALGLGGQTILVVPDRDLIVVTTAAVDGHDAIFRLIEQHILPAVETP